ncbi:MAG: hypothetical protein PHX27_02450 [Candidatus ainarchaeum sp.]|nr:hypothetical protein [Candidatus ainarchaeum sp.]
MKLQQAHNKFKKNYNINKENAQGALEYLLIIGSAILVVAIVIIALVTLSSSATENTQENGASTHNPLKEQVANAQGNHFIPKNVPKNFIYVGEEITLLDLKNSGENISVCFGTNCDDNTKIFDNDIIKIQGSQDGTIPQPNLTPTIEEAGPQICTFDQIKIKNKCVDCINGEEIDFFSGTGTPQDPYQICSWTQLDNVRSYLTKDFVLIKNLSNESNDYTLFNSNQGWNPIGTESTPFGGNFNGNNYSIKNLNINKPAFSNLGLFNFIQGNSQKNLIQNLIINEVNITGNNTIGILSANTKNSFIHNVHVHGTINGKTTIGGIIAKLNIDSNIYQSSSNCDITATATNAYNTVGGLVADISQDAFINESFSNSILKYSDAGIGGLVGWFSGTDTQKIRILNSYSNGTIINITPIQFNHYTGGFSGVTDVTNAIQNSYSITKVNSSTKLGGCFFGSAYDKIAAVNSFYNNTICTQRVDGLKYGKSGIIGKTTSEMKTPTTFTNADWDFDNIWTIDPTKNDGYPILKWQIN